MRFSRREEEDYSLRLTALVDVVFLLLIFFMVSTAFVDFTRQIDIELPQAKTGAAHVKAKVYTIEINKKGVIFLDGQPIEIADLASKLKDGRHEKRQVVLRADKRINYGLAVEIMDIARQSGITDIGVTVL
ncbi:MAG: biopolymer transporter ExbD [Nitrospinota bacterium]